MAILAMLISFLCLSPILCVNCRVLSSVSENSVWVSDGVNDHKPSIEFLSHNPDTEILSKNACVHVYGFLPCADNIAGHVFQVFSFGCLLLVGDYFLLEGRSKLFMIFEVGFYGGIVFPLLTMFTRIALMLCTALFASPEAAKSMVANNVGVTVGYTVFALTVQWGACVVFGLNNGSTSSDQSLTNCQLTASNSTSGSMTFFRSQKWKRLLRSKVNADSENKKGIEIMLLSLAPFIIVQISAIFDSSSWRNIIVLITMITSALSTLLYFVYSYYDMDVQKKALKLSRFELMSDVMKHLQCFSPKNLMRDGKLSDESLKSLFNKFDINKNGRIEVAEIKDVTVEFGLMGRIKCNIHELSKMLLEEFDEDNDGEIDEDEFKLGINKWLKEHKFNFQNEMFPCHNQTDDSSVLKVEKPRKSLSEKLLSMKTIRAIIEVVIGILIVIFLATPFMKYIQLLSVSAGVPSFYITFVVIPLARNLKNALSTQVCRKKDKAVVTSLTFSEIYRDVTMNNLMGLSIILAIVYTRGLVWDYSTEVLITVVVGLIIGSLAYVRSTYTFWVSVLALTLYVLSLLLTFLHFHLR